MKQLFVSYSRADIAAVDELVRRFSSLGYQGWVDSSLRGGQSWWEEILRQIADCDAFVAIVSCDLLNSVACQRERAWALALGKPVLPVVVEHLVQALPRELATRQIVDWTEPGPDAAFALAGALMALPLAPALPEVLPEGPPAPLSYLSDLGEQVSQSEPLTHEQQHQILTQLLPGLRSADREEQQGARYLLEKFSGRERPVRRRQPDAGPDRCGRSGHDPASGSLAGNSSPGRCTIDVVRVRGGQSTAGRGHAAISGEKA